MNRPAGGANPLRTALRRRVRRTPWLHGFVQRARRRLRRRRNPVHDRLRILLVPGFEKPEDWTDQVHRLAWYLAPLAGRVERIDVASGPGILRAGDVPDHLDPATAAGVPGLERLVHHFDTRAAPCWRDRLARADIVLRWSHDDATLPASLRSGIAPLLARKKTWNVDRQTNRFEGSHYLRCSHDASPRRAEDLQACRERLEGLGELLLRRGGDTGRCVLLGTGPSVAAADEYEFAGSVPILCNSLVKNHALLERTRPPVIVAADPIFHAGCSSYAGRFREDLVRCMRRFGSFFLVPFRDYALYATHLPEDLRERLIGVPLEHRAAPNLDLRQRFEVTSTANVMTLLMLPLATTFFEEIGIMGCDGRPLEENDRFWGHDRRSQFDDQLEPIRRAHPAFFAIDYDDYYLTHCDTLERYLSAAEQAGKRVTSLTFSHIPALQGRSPAPESA